MNVFIFFIDTLKLPVIFCNIYLLIFHIVTIIYINTFYELKHLQSFVKLNHKLLIR